MKGFAFLLEIYSEEIPPSAQDMFLINFEILTSKTLVQKSIPFANIKTNITSCRISVQFEIEKNSQISIKGPKTSAQEDAINGFMKKYEIANKNSLSIANEYYIYNTETNNISQIEHLLLLIFNEICIKASSIWPKKMRWDSSRFEWIRPIKSIVCMLESNIIPLNFCNTEANNTTPIAKRGLLESLTSNKTTKIEIKNANLYEATMQKIGVVISKAERIKTLKESAIKACQGNKDPNNTMPQLQEKLINKLAGLSENPTLLIGKIDERFKVIPDQILLQTMLNHQFYIPTYQQNGRIGDYFLCLADKGNFTEKTVKEGNERVLTARFSDAQFFFEKDAQTFKNINTIKIEPAIQKLERISLGIPNETIKTRADRIFTIFQNITKQITTLSKKDQQTIQNIIYISKLDLTTSVVQELTELQGSIGAEYWERWWSEDFEIENEKLTEKNLVSQISCFIRKQHEINNEQLGLLARIMIISNSLEHIWWLFETGNIPTSSQDPFGAKKHVKNILVQSMGTGYSSESISINFNDKNPLPNKNEATSKSCCKFIIDRFIKKEKTLICSTWNIDENNIKTKLFFDENKNTLINANLIKIENELYSKNGTREIALAMQNRLNRMIESLKTTGSEEEALEAEMALIKKINNRTTELEKATHTTKTMVEEIKTKGTFNEKEIYEKAEEINQKTKELVDELESFIEKYIISLNQNRVATIKSAANTLKSILNIVV